MSHNMNIDITPEEQDRRAQIRRDRELRQSFEDWVWRRWDDEHDIFDLRFLFDEEEIREERRQLIDYEETYGQNPEYYRYMLYENDEENEEQNEEEMEEENGDEVDRRLDILIENENWDNIRYDIRFDMRLGFYTRYDSGIEMSDEENEQNDIRLDWDW